jgi:hypothetical protein
MRWLDANLEEKQEPRVASAPEAQKGDSVSSSRRLDTGRDREADIERAAEARREPSFGE